MYKTLAASMVAAYTQAAPLEGLPPVTALPQFIEGFAVEFYKVNNLTDPMCISMFEGDFQDVITAINDLKSGDFQGAVTALTAWVATIQPDLQKCEAAVMPELKDIENYFGQYINDRSKLEKKVAEALALHHKKVEADIAAVKNDFDSGDFKDAGTVAADLLELVLGPVEKKSVQGLPPVTALPEFVEGFTTEFVKVNNLTELSDCVGTVHVDVDDVKKIISDLTSGDIKDAITEITALAASIKPDLQNCETEAKQEFTDVENYFGQYLSDKSKLEK